MKLAHSLMFLPAVLLLGITQVSTVSADPVQFIAERDVPSGGPDLYLLTYPSLTDLLNNTNLTQNLLSLPLSNDFSLGGFTVDGGSYRFIAERDVPSGGPDLYLLTYPSLTDLLNNTNLTQNSVPLPLSNDFSLGGFTVDGGSYRFIAERDVPSGGPDLYLLTYPSLSDTFGNINLTQNALSLPLSNDFSLGGFTVDGGSYRFIAERDVPSGGPNLYLLTYPSLTDLLNNTNFTQNSVPLPLSNDFSLGGFNIQNSSPQAVPEPPAAALFGVGLVGLAMVWRRRRSAIHSFS